MHTEYFFCFNSKWCWATIGSKKLTYNSLPPLYILYLFTLIKTYKPSQENNLPCTVLTMPMKYCQPANCKNTHTHTFVYVRERERGERGESRRERELNIINYNSNPAIKRQKTSQLMKNRKEDIYLFIYLV